MLVHEGWENNRRVHGCVVHAKIRNDKIWIHYDGIEDGITDELVAAGVPKDCIVLAFIPKCDRYLCKHLGVKVFSGKASSFPLPLYLYTISSGYW